MRYYYLDKDQEIFSISQDMYSDYVMEDIFNHSISNTYITKDYAVVSNNKLKDSEYKKQVSDYEQRGAYD